jgi:hypothetical protein
MAELFLYGADRDGPAAAYFADVRAVPASVRGRLYRDDRARLGLLPTPDGPAVAGVLVSVPDARLPLLDLLHGGGLCRARVLASVHLQARNVDAWVLTTTPRLPWRPVRRER